MPSPACAPLEGTIPCRVVVAVCAVFVACMAAHAHEIADALLHV
jgi:hypothetical protein